MERLLELLQRHEELLKAANKRLVKTAKLGATPEAMEILERRC